MKRVLPEDGGSMPVKQEPVTINENSSFRVLSRALPLGFEPQGINYCLDKERDWALMTLYRNHMIINIR